MNDIRTIIFIVGLFLCILGAGMILPLLVDIYAGNPGWRIFFTAMVVTFFFGGLLSLTTARERHNLTITRRQGFLMIVLTWLTLSLFGAVPFWFTGTLTFTDAVFESVSGLTTTGATIITNLGEQSPGILLWRAILQWLGGIGVVLMALSLLPFLRIGGMQIFETEMGESEKALPRTASLATSLGGLYLALTIICAILYFLAGLTPFHALAHAMTTISTGGFSTYDSSFMHYEAPWIELVAILFMILGGLPFVLYLKAVNGDIMKLLKDTQVRWFLAILATAIIVICAYRILSGHDPDHIILPVIFNVVSVMTGTGFANDDFNSWGALPISLFFFLMFMGACAGSTSCGIKIFRFQILFAIAVVQLKRLLYPHGVFVPYYNHRPVPDGVPASVMSFFFIFALVYAATVLALSWTGLDFMTCLSGAGTAIANMGIGLGPQIGPTGTFAPLPDSAKWTMAAAMIIGRLEIFTVLVLFTPHFWRR